MENLLKVLEQNSLAALGAGVVIGLYIVGKIESVDEDHLPRFLNADDEIAWHHARIAHLQAIRQAKMSKDQTLEELVRVVAELQKEIEGMKHE